MKFFNKCGYYKNRTIRIPFFKTRKKISDELKNEINPYKEIELELTRANTGKLLDYPIMMTIRNREHHPRTTIAIQEMKEFSKLLNLPIITSSQFK